MTASPGAGGRRLTPAQVLLIVVVSVLVLLFIGLLLARMGDDGAPAADAGSTTPSATSTQGEPAPSATSSVSAADGSAPTQESEPEYFTSPSGNIACAITVDSADCAIASFGYEPEDLGSCDVDGAGGHLRVESAGATMPCDPLVVAGDVPVLDYDETTTAHGYTCESAESGVTCRHDESGYGFTVARAAYELF